MVRGGRVCVERRCGTGGGPTLGTVRRRRTGVGARNPSSWRGVRHRVTGTWWAPGAAPTGPRRRRGPRIITFTAGPRIRGLVPVIRFHVSDLVELIGKDVDKDTLRDTIPQLGADIDDADGDEWAIEFFPDRPDLFTVEGIARALRAYFGVEPGLKEYRVEAAADVMVIDPSVDAVRPCIACAIVRGVEITDRRLDALIELQEDLHWGLGARRRKVAIGVHDLAPLNGPYTYRAVAPGEVRFEPLKKPGELMDLGEILVNHETGREFAHLLDGHDKYPVILDGEGQVLSFPPIINGTLTTVTTETTDVFVDVTGTEEWAVRRALNLITTSLAESGGRVYGITLQRETGEDTTPDLEPEKRTLRAEVVNRFLGTKFTSAEIAEKLQRMGYGADATGDGVHVDVPAYRTDIMHEVDLIEDVAIGHGFNTFEYQRPKAVTYGSELPWQTVARRGRMALTGRGFQEMMSLSLSNVDDQFTKLGLPEGYATRVKNPATTEHALLRVNLLPSILNVLKANTHRDLPQQLFEVSRVTVGGEGGIPEHENRIAGAWVAGKVGYSDIKGLVQGICQDLGWDFEIEASTHPAYLPGRQARLKGHGVFGEIHPRTLNAFGVGHPMVAFEFAF